MPAPGSEPTSLIVSIPGRVSVSETKKLDY
jgi:hypothetical protein